MVHIYNGLSLDIRKNKISPSPTAWADLEAIVLSEISQTDKYKYHMTSVTCRI